MSLNYEEQVKVIGIKSNTYYTIYKINLEDREDLKA